MSWSILVSLLISAVTLIYFWINKKFSYWKDRGFLYAEPKFPFGCLKDVGIKIHFSEVSKKIYNDFKSRAPAIGIYFFTSPVLYVMDLDLIKHILVKDFNNFVDRGIYFHSEADPLSAHLFAIEGNEWRKLRNKLTPTFTSGKMKMMFPTVSSTCDEMIKHVSDLKTCDIEMKDILGRFTTDVIGTVAFGLDLSSMKDPKTPFRVMGLKMFNLPNYELMKILFVTTFKNFSRKLRMKVVPGDVSEFFLKSIRETVEYREKNKIVRNDFLNLLMELKNHGRLKDSETRDEVDKLTFNELAAQAFLFFIAGFETSSTTMTFALYELALNLHDQDKLREEIKTILDKNSNELTYEGMNEMKYLQMVIDETLRKYPPVDTLIRTANNDYQLPGTDLSIEKGTLVMIPAFPIQHDSNIYEDPEKFEPERFNEENKKNHHPMAQLAFGDGPRNCIGNRFGYMQTKIGLIKLILNFKFSPSEKTSIPIEFSPASQVLSPKYDMWLKVEKIQDF